MKRLLIAAALAVASTGALAGQFNGSGFKMPQWALNAVACPPNYGQTVTVTGPFYNLAPTPPIDLLVQAPQALWVFDSEDCYQGGIHLGANCMTTPERATLDLMPKVEEVTPEVLTPVAPVKPENG